MSSSKNLAGVSRTNIFITKSSFLLWKNGIFSVNCWRIILTIPVLCDLGKSLITSRMAKVFVYSCLIIFLSFLTSVLAMLCALANWRTISTLWTCTCAVSVCSVRMAVKCERRNDQAQTPIIIQINVKAVSALRCDPTSISSPYIGLFKPSLLSAKVTLDRSVVPKPLSH
jgi:hypothetical protein